ncbi:MAG TPA: hypothetical protein VGQ36_16350 [Thermoanaerobaculia bacterium]|jgi:tetratricopeptide (TPR) repeat protein|nr:hypothetical protein [Thermoanaerobaculia bacterium]
MHDETKTVVRSLIDARTSKEESVRRLRKNIAAMAQLVCDEDEAAVALCDEVLTGPSAWWPQRLHKTPGAKTAGVARQLALRSRSIVENRPADALQLAQMAIEIAEALHPEDYPHGHVLRARAQALRQEAMVLSFMGRFPECLDSVTRAARVFEQVPCAQFDLARLAIAKAVALLNLSRNEEAAELAREAGETFVRFHDRPLSFQARMVEAAALYEGAAVERALKIWESLEHDPNLGPAGAVHLAHNIAICRIDLGREVDAVIEPLRRCIVEFEALGMLTERSRSRWKLGTALMVCGRVGEAIPILRLAWHEFAEMSMMVDGALAALDLAEALLANEQPDQVPMICHDVIAQLTKAGMTSYAITALSLLREAAAMGQASRDLVRTTHATVRRVTREEAQLSAPGEGGET